jgi:hypothetical protein
LETLKPLVNTCFFYSRLTIGFCNTSHTLLHLNSILLFFKRAKIAKLIKTRRTLGTTTDKVNNKYSWEYSSGSCIPKNFKNTDNCCIRTREIKNSGSFFNTPRTLFKNFKPAYSW